MLNIAILSLSCYINYVSCLSLTSPAIIEKVVGRSVTITYVTDVTDNDIFNFEINYNNSQIAEGTKRLFDKIPPTPFGNRLRTSSSLQSQKKYSLRIDNLKYNDTGLFFAEIRIFGSNLKANSTTKLIIYGGPSIISNLSSSYASENETNFEVSIVLQGHPKPQVTWEFAGDKNVRVKTIDDKNRKYRYILIIPIITREMNGKVLSYKAVGYNDNKVVGSTKLNVTYSPTFCGAAVKEGIEFADVASAMFTTHVCGNPMPAVSMEFGGQSVVTVLHAEKDKYKYTVNLTPYLIPSRCGNVLTVTAKNNKGERTSRIVLKYKLSPIPINSTMRKVGSCIDTNWSAPNTGECDVSYKVDYLDSNNVIVHSTVFHNKELQTESCDTKVVSKTISVRVTAVSNDTRVEPGDGDGKTSGNTVAVIVGIVVAVVVVIIIVVAFAAYHYKRNSEKDSEKQSTGSGRRPLNEETPFPHRSDADGYAIADDLIENNVERKNNTEGISLAQLDDGTYDQLEVMNDNPYIKNGASVDNAAAKANLPNNMKTYDSAANAVDKQPKKPEVYAYSRPRNTGDYNGVNPLAGKSTNQNLYSEPERQTSPEQPLGAGKSGAANPNLYAQVEKDRKQPSKGEKYQPQHYDKVCDPPEVPAHIQQMYAQIDKSKKQKK
uniref:Allorecognition 2 n=3 Tax=Hydractinia symbiolongicarpus TaxID=13093 RepID=E3U3H4_HYDSY|nr:allorecognition 2 [Hydractinia symbiolongicarpus]